MIVTIFRSRLRPEAVEDYTRWATRMSELARAMPGYVSHTAFTAEDGERVTIVEFESEDTHRAWAMHPEHLQAQRKGRAEFYETFSLQVCQPLRESRFP